MERREIMFDKLMRFLGIDVDDTDFDNEEPKNESSQIQAPLFKSFNGIILEKKENELIICSETNEKVRMRLLIVEKALLPNMVYPSLCDKNHCAIEYNQISIRDKVVLEFDNELKDDVVIPINGCNNMITLIDYDIKEKTSN